MTDKYAVIGHPIAHSKSPLIHAEFAKQTKQALQYQAILAPLDDFTATVKSLIAQGFKGANVTVPFKLDAFNLCDILTPRAQAAGAVNTLSFVNGKINGDNTDGIGLVNDITLNYAHALQGAQILVVGAGGAARGIMLPLIALKPASILVANRTLANAMSLVEIFSKNAACPVTACDFGALNQPFLQRPFDCIINATSASLSANVNDASLAIGDEAFGTYTFAYDMMYGLQTAFMAQARFNGAQVADGLGMLVEQAAEAFYLWRNIRPETAPVIAQLRQA